MIVFLGSRYFLALRKAPSPLEEKTESCSVSTLLIDLSPSKMKRLKTETTKQIKKNTGAKIWPD